MTKHVSRNNINEAKPGLAPLASWGCQIWRDTEGGRNGAKPGSMRRSGKTMRVPWEERATHLLEKKEKVAKALRVSTEGESGVAYSQVFGKKKRAYHTNCHRLAKKKKKDPGTVRTSVILRGGATFLTNACWEERERKNQSFKVGTVKKET